MVIRGGTVLVGPPATGRFERADVVVAEGRIAEIRPSGATAPEGAEVLDATGRFVLPGFVDAHHHLWQTTMRGLTAEWDLMDMLWSMRLHHTALHSPDDVHAGTLAGALAALEAGTTTTIDVAHVITTPDHADAGVNGIRESGIRAVWAYGLATPPAAESAFPSERHRMADVERVRGTYFPADSPADLPTGPSADLPTGLRTGVRTGLRTGGAPAARVVMGLAANEIGSVPWETTRGEFRLARELGVLLTAHTNVFGGPDAPREIAWLRHDGLLGPLQLHAHATSSTDEELRWLAESGAAVASTVETELQMGLGHPVFARAMAAGVTVGLGTDIQSNNSGDLFAQMRLAMQCENGRSAERRLASGGVGALRGTAVRPRDVLHLATLGGARALGLGEVTGSLEPGKAADLVLLRHDRLYHRPVTDPFATVVLHCGPGDVDAVLVDGEVLKRDGQLTRRDAPSVMGLIDAAARRLRDAMEREGGPRLDRPDDLPERLAERRAGNLPDWAV
ncbi:hypothetical protein D7319_03705 [Streptomyces radicis]|uniref:Amidohydrolase-related domain-containing protein n=2 Tax=Streptomyces radicis TaxID=1750517 RepID=A0A3A9X0P1_9ACTN|nr:hypothetical protein D7319_03705 [Streptomyces radicis]RKN25932.1 hypothetical protein D7318_06775 [Streptomyces radicis]